MAVTKIIFRVHDYDLVATLDSGQVFRWQKKNNSWTGVVGKNFVRLAQTHEGIFAETAGGVTAGVTQKLLRQGRIGSGDTTVVCITGNGLKTTDAIAAEFPLSEAIAPRIEAFVAYLESQLPATAAARA